MNSLTKSLVFVSAMLFLTSFMPTRLGQAAIFEGTVDEEGNVFGLCLDAPDDPACANVNCDTPEFAENPLCISEAAAGTGIAKGSLSTTGITSTDNFGDYIKKLVNFSLPYLTLAAFLGYVVAGFMYVTAMGNDEQLQKAKKILVWSTIGLILVILSFAITQLLTGELVDSLNQ